MKSAFCWRAGVTLTAEITTSKRFADRLSMMVSKLVVTTCVCKPMRCAIAVIKSMSKPAGLLVVVSMYSCGGYVVSLPTVSVPGTNKSLGGVTVGVAGLAVGVLPL